MVRTMLKLNNPPKIYIFWVLIVISFCLIGVPILLINKSGGEQIELTLLSYAIGTLVYGLFTLSILTSLNVKMAKKILAFK